jgi:hypothetical protein
MRRCVNKIQEKGDAMLRGHLPQFLLLLLLVRVGRRSWLHAFGKTCALAPLWLPTWAASYCMCVLKGTHHHNKHMSSMCSVCHLGPTSTNLPPLYPGDLQLRLPPIVTHSKQIEVAPHITSSHRIAPMAPKGQVGGGKR